MANFCENPKIPFFISATLQGDMAMIQACEWHTFKASEQFFGFHSINHDIWAKKLQNQVFSSENSKNHRVWRFSSQKLLWHYSKPSSKSIWAFPAEICLQETYCMLLYQIPRALRMRTCPQSCGAYKIQKGAIFSKRKCAPNGRFLWISEKSIFHQRYFTGC